eukprot:184530_1
MSLSSSNLQGEQTGPPQIQVEDSNHEQFCQFTMTLHLDNALIQLTTDQMLQILEIINRHPDNPSQKIKNNINLKDEDGIQYEYTFDTNDTFLHSIFGDTSAQTIKQIVDHKLMLILIIILGIIGFTGWVILGEDSIVQDLYIITICCVLVIPWLIFKHLLFNKIALKLCLQTFDFWLKVAYGLIAGVASSFLGFSLYVVTMCIFSALVVLIISYISAFDAVHSSKTKKLIVSVFAASLMSIFAVNTQFLLNDEDDYKISIQLSHGMNIISMQSLIASSCRILAIFLWKQSYKAYRSKGRSVTIVKSARITWIDTTKIRKPLTMDVRTQNMPQNVTQSSKSP